MSDWDDFTERYGFNAGDPDAMDKIIDIWDRDDISYGIDNSSKFINKDKELERIEINLTPKKYLDLQGKYLRTQLVNNQLDNANISLEVIHNKFNTNDPLALEVYCNGVMIGFVQKYDSSININNFCFSESKKIKNLILKWTNNKFYLSKDVSFVEKKKIKIQLKKKQNLSNNPEKTPIERLLFWADENNIDTSKLPRNKSNLLHLKLLNLDDMKIKYLTPEIENLINLKILNLSQNSLKGLPKEIENLRNLRKLNLSRNRFLKILPKEIGKLTNLRELDLSGNSLTTLPKEIGNLSSLRELDLSSNPLTKLPDEITHLTKLEYIKFPDDNKITFTMEQKIWLRSINKLGTVLIDKKFLLNEIDTIEQKEPKNISKVSKDEKVWFWSIFLIFILIGILAMFGK